MKLKKIASLALAGIMAVSMLAGCKDGTSQEDPSSSSQVPTTANIVSYANDALSGDEKEVFTFANNETLNTALQAVAADKTKCTSDKVSAAYARYTVAHTDVDSDLANAVIGKLGNGIYYSINGWSTWTGNVATNNEKTSNYVEVFMMSGALSEKAVAENIVKRWDGNINDTNFHATQDNCKVDYSAAISAVKVENPEKATETAWVVAVMFTKTGTSTANA